jgi:hypothetical protein
MTVKKLGLASVAAVVIAGCGGGSSSPAPQQNLQSARAPSQPMEVASTTLTATDSSGNTWTATYSSTAGGTVTFNGQTANTDLIALTISENGAVVATEDSTAYFLSDPYSPLGVSGTTSGIAWTAVVTSFTPLPTTLTVGGSGPVLSATYYDGMGTAIGSLTETYTVTADGPTDLFLNINGAGSINGAHETETLTFSVTSAGALALVKAVYTLNGETLTFQ